MTEAIMQHFLVDFETAETLKRTLQRPTGPSEVDLPVSYTNILGLPQASSPQEIMAAAEKASDALCTAIGESIQKLNQENPVAVFLVGGGSRFPTLCTKVAQALGLPPERVALGGTKEYKNIRLSTSALLSPEFVTPLGILANSLAARTRDYFSILVNDQKIMLWETGSLKVLDALLLAGIKASQLMGHNPAPLSFTLNGVKRTVRGTPATPGQLLLNGSEASLDSPVRQGDHIQVVFSSDGLAPSLLVRDLLKEFDETCRCRINGQEVVPNQSIAYGDQVEITSTPTPISLQFHICLNGSWLDVPADEETGLLQFAQLLNFVQIDTRDPKGELILTINGKDAAFTDVLTEGDQVEIRWSEE